MKPSTLAARHTIQREHAIRVKPRLIAEWEYNRFFAPTVTVTPDQSGDSNWNQWYGDLSSIVQPNRPSAGIAKARADGTVRPTGKYRDTPEETRFYPSYEYDEYTYWSSLQRSELSPQGDGSYTMDSPIVLTVTYPQAIAVNKIVVGFELGYCKPRDTSIQISEDGTTWDTIAVNPAIDGEGLVELWNNKLGWSDTPEYDLPVVIKAVRLNVYTLDTPYAHLDVLQVSPRLENDLSDYLVSYDTTFEVSSPSFIAPMGKASSNEASVTLSNIDGRFSNENEDSLYYGMIEKKVKFKLDVGIDTSAQGGAPGVYEYIREFTMWTDSWASGDNSASTVQVALKDSSVILQERNMPAMFLENTTVGAVVWQVMDRIGMTNYTYSKSEEELGQLIPFYWPSDTSENSNPRWGRLMVSTTPPANTTIWDELSALAEATQTALFFDQNDQLQIVARKQMYNNNKAVNWNLDAVPNGQKLPDLVDATRNFDLATNQVEITYRPAAMSNDNNGFPIMATVWQPTAQQTTSTVPTPQDDSSSSTDIVLRAAAMISDLLKTDTNLWIDQSVAVIWPWESDINIEGEVLHYVGKEYAYYDASNHQQVAVVTSLTQQQSLDALNVNLAWKNAYTGKFIVTQRGMYGSNVSDHKVKSDNYTALMTRIDNTAFAPVNDSSYVTQKSGYITQYSATGDIGTYTLRKHESAVLPIPSQGGDKTVWYGTKIRFPSGYTSSPTDPSSATDQPELSTPSSNFHTGGIWFAGDWGDAGFFLEFSSTGQVDGWEGRTFKHEIFLYGMPGNAGGYNTTPVSGDPKGVQFAILEDAWYSVDVAYTERTNGQVAIDVFMDGVAAGNWLVSSPPNYTNQWRFGTFVLGPSMGMDIEYLYAVAEDETNPFRNPDQTSFLDLVTGSYASGFVYKNIKYNFNQISPSYTWPYGTYYFTQTVDNSHMILDEYGPTVHEMRLFDVQFNQSSVPAPASFLYLSNSSQVECLSYQSDAFGAEFMLANASRDNAIVNGEDKITRGADNPITQTILIYGRAVYTAQNDIYLVKKDDDAIRRQGLIRTQFTSRYIQTDEMAADIGNWILSLWASGVDEVDVTIFGNPLFQVGDLVTINHPAQGMVPSTHQYFVITTSNAFDSGYKSTLKLRRARITGPINASV